MSEVRTDLVEASSWQGELAGHPGVGWLCLFWHTQDIHSQKLLPYQQPDGSRAVSLKYSSRKTAARDITGASRSKISAKSEMGIFSKYVALFCWHTKPCSGLLVFSHPQLPLPILLSPRVDLYTHPFSSFAKQEHYTSTQSRNFPRRNLLEFVLKTHQLTFCLRYFQMLLSYHMQSWRRCRPDSDRAKPWHSRKATVDRVNSLVLFSKLICASQIPTTHGSTLSLGIHSSKMHNLHLPKSYKLVKDTNTIVSTTIRNSAVTRSSNNTALELGERKKLSLEV